jgi:hypothetical protein
MNDISPLQRIIEVGRMAVLVNAWRTTSPRRTAYVVSGGESPTSYSEQEEGSIERGGFAWVNTDFYAASAGGKIYKNGEAWVTIPDPIGLDMLSENLWDVSANNSRVFALAYTNDDPITAVIYIYNHDGDLLNTERVFVWAGLDIGNDMHCKASTTHLILAVAGHVQGLRIEDNTLVSVLELDPGNSAYMCALTLSERHFYVPYYDTSGVLIFKRYTLDGVVDDFVNIPFSQIDQGAECDSIEYFDVVCAEVTHQALIFIHHYGCNISPDPLLGYSVVNVYAREIELNSEGEVINDTIDTTAPVLSQRLSEVLPEWEGYFTRNCSCNRALI